MTALRHAQLDAFDRAFRTVEDDIDHPYRKSEGLRFVDQSPIFVGGEDGLHADGLVHADRSVEPSLDPYHGCEICFFEWYGLDISDPSGQQVGVDDPD